MTSPSTTFRTELQTLREQILDAIEAHRASTFEEGFSSTKSSWLPFSTGSTS